MNIVKTTDQYDDSYIYFCDPIKNNIMNDGFFIRILYSTPFFVLNGINLSISINNVSIEKYYNKYRCSFNANNHKQMIDTIRIIEENLLKNVNIKNKIPQFKIFEQLRNGNIKIFSENIDTSCYQNNNNNNNNNINTVSLFMLKISGVWETEFHYGVTYKFIKINHL
jgi:hypothetical protein